MGKRTSVCISGLLQKRVQERHDIDTSISSTINLTAARYEEMLIASRPTLETNEWNALMDAITARPPYEIPLNLRLDNIYLAVEDSMDLDDLGSKWKVPSSFLKKVKAFSFAERLAVLEISEKWIKTDFKLRQRLIA